MKNFVFDLYGTLVDIRTDESSQKFKDKYLKYIKKFGADGTFFDNFFAMLAKFGESEEPDMSAVLRNAVEASGGSIAGLEEEAMLKFRRLSTHKLKLYRGVEGLLSELKRRGAKLYLLSNAQAVFTVYELKKLGIYGCFDGIELSSDFGKKKPSPEFFDYLIKKYSLNPSETVFTGNDIFCDIEPSKKAGMYAVYINSAISPAEDTLADAKRKADFACDSFCAAEKHLISLIK